MVQLNNHLCSIQNSHLLLVFMHLENYIYLHSYAWPGSSGSSGLDEDGKLIGILSAISVGPGMYGMPMPIEDIVIVAPIWKLNFDLLDMNLKSLDL